MFETKKINIGHLSTLYHTSFILMGTDWLKKSGIQANWKLFASGPDIVKAFEKKEIDIGYIGLPPAIIGMDRGVPLVCVAGGHVEGSNNKRRTYNESNVFYISDGGCRRSVGNQYARARVHDG